ncbi:acyl-CoA desaturase [Yoonia sp. GPGPB17]|uniref:acyl-CoA desaturase n=1 Tax=Yoonia sp. GPGPB17 TaxID=3026147 RepID=UPI0030C1A148
MLMGGVLAIIWTPSWSGCLVFLTTTAITVCAGHSVGMHRLLIHRSFETPKWLEYMLVWLGTLVGMAGPFGMIRAHDMRDWHQRQTVCPPHPSHGAGFWQDAWWQMHCRFDLDHPPKFEIEPEIANDRVYQWIERHWMAQQIVVAVPLFLIGGVEFVLWGVCLRVAVSLSGHWLVGHFAHRGGHQGWTVEGLPVQGYNLPGLGLLTFGENWHSNHHAFPHSARLGIEKGQLDPGYWFIRSLAAIGLAHRIREPEDLPERDGLKRLEPENMGVPQTS